MPLPIIPLPLPPNGPPSGYDWEERDISALSTTTAFNTGIDRRDIFLGRPRCIVCGSALRNALEHCHIIMQSQPELWSMLKEHHWIPQQAKSHPEHESCDGILMCSTHHAVFDGYDFFIRYLPGIRKFVFVNYSGLPDLQQFHGKAVALDIGDHYAPFPSLFIIHEMRVRGFHPFQPITPDMPDTIRWQDWILSDAVFDDATNSFLRDRPPANNNEAGLGGSQPQLQPMTSTGGGGHTLELNADVINSILAATHAMPSWKACQMEGTSWNGTAEENIRKYASSTELNLGLEL